MSRTRTASDRARTGDACRAITDAAKDLTRAVAELWLRTGDLDALEIADARGRVDDAPTLRALAEALDACLYHFGTVQRAAGLPGPHEPRYHRFLGGRLDE